MPPARRGLEAVFSIVRSGSRSRARPAGAGHAAAGSRPDWRWPGGCRPWVAEVLRRLLDVRWPALAFMEAGTSEGSHRAARRRLPAGPRDRHRRAPETGFPPERKAAIVRTT